MCRLGGRVIGNDGIWDFVGFCFSLISELEVFGWRE